MKQIIYIAALLCMTLSSCTKEIEIDYRDIDPIPVIEGYLAPDLAEVKITMTRNMDDSVHSPGIEVDYVAIFKPDGTECTLDYQPDGIYRPASPISLTDGATYTLRVTIDGVKYVAQSSLRPTIQISEPQFVWANIMDWMQVMEFETLNIPDGEEAYGWVRIHHNGEIYFSDAGKCTGNSPFDIGLYYDSDMEMDEDEIIYDGDTLLLDVRSIDLDAYTYLSESHAGNMNPTQYFSTSVSDKVCLGFFAAYNHVQYEIIYHKTPHE